MAVATNYESYRWKGAIEPDAAASDTGYTTARWKGAIEPAVAAGGLSIPIAMYNYRMRVT